MTCIKCGNEVHLCSCAGGLCTLLKADINRRLSPTVEAPDLKSGQVQGSNPGGGTIFVSLRQEMWDHIKAILESNGQDQFHFDKCHLCEEFRNAFTWARTEKR